MTLQTSRNKLTMSWQARGGKRTSGDVRCAHNALAAAPLPWAKHMERSMEGHGLYVSQRHTLAA